MEDTRAAKLQERMPDGAFVERLTQQIRQEDARACFAARGVDFTPDEITAMGKAVSLNAKQQRGEELTEDALAEVSGG